jgi:hypothetical protein
MLQSKVFRHIPKITKTSNEENINLKQNIGINQTINVDEQTDRRF